MWARAPRSCSLFTEFSVISRVIAAGLHEWGARAYIA